MRHGHKLQKAVKASLKKRSKKNVNDVPEAKKSKFLLTFQNPSCSSQNPAQEGVPIEKKQKER